MSEIIFLEILFLCPPEGKRLLNIQVSLSSRHDESPASHMVSTAVTRMSLARAAPVCVCVYARSLMVVCVSVE